MSFAVVSSVTFGIVSPATVVVVGITTFTVALEISGMVAAAELPEIAARSTDPETSETWTPPISRLFVFFNNWSF